MISTDVLHALFNGCTHLDALETKLSKGRKDLIKAVQVLKKRGLLLILSKGDYCLTEAGSALAASGATINPGQGPRPRTKVFGIRERAWWHFRAHGIATLKEIIGTHANGTELDPETNLYKYLNSLEKAGVLARCAKRIPARQSRGLVQWKLLKDLGPKAPVWREREKVIYDPNKRETLPIERGAE